jgi:hypothetical protein
MKLWINAIIRGGNFEFTHSKIICNNSIYTSSIRNHENILFAIKIKSLRNLAMKLWKNAFIRGGHFECSLSKNVCNNYAYTSGIHEHDNIVFATKIKSLYTLEMKLWKNVFICGCHFEFNPSKNVNINSMKIYWLSPE